MKAKVIDSTEHLRQQQQQQPRQPRLEDTPQYKEALVNATNDLLGETIGNLGDARARVALYEQSLRQLQAQLQALQQQAEEKADPAEIAKLQRQVEAETRERQALEGQLKEMRKRAEVQKEQLDQVRQEAAQAETGLRNEIALKSNEIARLEDRNQELEDDAASLLELVADIRTAAGDSEAKLMQEELVKHIETLVANQKKPRKKAAPKKKTAPKKK